MSSATDAGRRAPRASLGALKSVLPYALVYKGRIAAALAALFVASAATLVVPVAVRRMVDFGFSDANAGVIRSYFLGMLVVVAVLAIASGLRYYYVMTLGERVVADVRSDLFTHLTRLDPGFFDAEKTGEIASRLSADTTQLKATFGSSASIALRNLFMFVGAVAMMVVTSAWLSAYVLAAIPVIVLPLFAAGRAVRQRSRRAQDTLADATAFATESLSAVRVMQSFVAEKFTAGRYRQAAYGAYEAARSMAQARGVVTAAALFLAFGSVVIVLWAGAQAVVAGSMSGGTLTQFLLYAVLGAGALGQLTEVWNEVSQAAGAAGRIGELLAVEPRIAAPAKPLALARPVRGEVTFDAVDFAYPGRGDEPVLSDVGFRVAPGEVVAIVGPSGAGKSTLFQLALRFYDPTRGVVRLDGVDVAKLDPAALRAEIALVPQDAFIFGASVADNIAYGAPGASREKIAAAAKKAAADGFISAMPQGYDTLLGERGVTLSGGERQRIAIARAILKDAPVLLLDEATSALDAENETLVQGALETLMKGRTTLVIAHRLATIVNAHRILVLEAGSIVEEGTHASLLAANGLYARLARLQFETGAAALTAAPVAEAAQ
ncbi:ATP-binding cassette subfamily B protein [Roseiarcus fermentans]|uniref:ATP-binding cassette subfamily B protein n=1 Tax=Roseiarcus fermentans TaxID=1473586 RepID=A0A366EF93_9HYPH|nr:ABC transporter transmembrane domain-containing protein [Roseiarcus fermentans]RBP01091.1 ATP-binding cassette subfamily B protein [Roseiarcus fermentans]